MDLKRPSQVVDKYGDIKAQISILEKEAEQLAVWLKNQALTHGVTVVPGARYDYQLQQRKGAERVDKEKLIGAYGRAPLEAAGVLYSGAPVLAGTVVAKAFLAEDLS